MDEYYVQQRNDLQKALTEFYRKFYLKVNISPEHEELGADVIDVYVRPPILACDLVQQHRGITTGIQVTSYKQMLFHDNGLPYENIYLIAKPGEGKTTFCTHLSAVWCQAHNPDESAAKQFDNEDIQALRQYQLAFFIGLREVQEFTGLREQSLCEVDEMVTSFISSRLTIDVRPTLLKKMLFEESCLIVLDGLDEWNHPKPCKVEKEPRDIPHQKLHNNYTVVTTTRSWKLDFIRLKPSEYDRRLVIHELDDSRLTELETKAVKILNRIYGESKTADDFSQAMKKINLGEISHTPYVRLKCLCLWFNDKDIGESKCQIYANLIEATLERQKNKLQSEFRKDIGNADVPLCFKHNKYCKQHMALLRSVGKMACDSIINKENRQLLVMDFDFFSRYLTEEELRYCLKLGLLIQNKDCGKVSTRVTNVSFPHKTVHEFYGALYLQSAGTTSSRPGCDVTSPSSEHETVENVIADVCSDLSKILEISTVLIFLSGLDSQQCSQILKTLSTVVTRDSTCKAYRARADLVDSDDEYKAMFNFQTLLTNCACEMKLNGDEVQSLPLEDFIINERSKEAEQLSLLQSILLRTETKIKTLNIQEYNDITEVTQLFDSLNLRSLRYLEKLVLEAVAKEQDVQQLLQQSKNTLRTLCLVYINYKEHIGRYRRCRTELSEETTDMFLNLQLLKAVRLSYLRLSHEQWEIIAASITSRTTMTQIWLGDITCRDHRKSCQGVQIDLSLHENLELLALAYLPVSQLLVNSQSLEECMIGDVPSSVISSWFQSLQTAQNLHILKCLLLSEDNARIMIGTIPKLLYLKELRVSSTNLGDRRLRLPCTMTELSYIGLIKVTLTSESLRNLVDTVSHLAQSVYVRLENCTVLPEGEYKAIKQEISESGRYSVMHDRPSEYAHEVFWFRTVTDQK